MASRLGLTRDQLATFLKDHEQIRQFERLFADVQPLEPTTLLDLAVNVGNADQKAVEALDALNRIANALEMLAAAPVIEKNNSVVTDYVDFNELPPLPEDKPGRAYWNQDDGTMDVDLYGGNVLQVGQELMYYARNTTANTVQIGTPVMFTGTVGSSGKLTFGLAVANGTVLADYMMGVTSQTIAPNDYGYVTSFGLVRGFNTTGAPYGESWANGDLLYFNPATPGTWTKFQPAAPNIDVPVAVVVNAGSGGSGSIFVRMTVAEALSRLQDVQAPSPSNNDILVYVSANSRWQNQAPATARASLGLGSGTPSNGQLLIGNGTDFTTANLSAGSNITITNGPGSVSIAASFSTTGSTGSVTLAEVSPGGTQGSLTFANGLITAFVAPT